MFRKVHHVLFCSLAVLGPSVGVHHEPDFSRPFVSIRCPCLFQCMSACGPRFDISNRDVLAVALALFLG